VKRLSDKLSRESDSPSRSLPVADKYEDRDMFARKISPPPKLKSYSSGFTGVSSVSSEVSSVVSSGVLSVSFSICFYVN
jgi:hypothetical protein